MKTHNIIYGVLLVAFGCLNAMQPEKPTVDQYSAALHTALRSAEANPAGAIEAMTILRELGDKNLPKIRKGSVRVRVTVKNETNAPFTLRGWAAGSRGPKAERSGSDEKKSKPVTVAAGKEGRFHLTYGKPNPLANETEETAMGQAVVESQEVIVHSDQSPARMTFFCTIQPTAETNVYCCSGRLIANNIGLPPFAINVARPLTTAGELRLVLTLKGANLQDSTITPA